VDTVLVTSSMTLAFASPLTTISSFVWGMIADALGLTPTGTVKLLKAEATAPNVHARPAIASDTTSVRRVMCISVRWARSAPRVVAMVVDFRGRQHGDAIRGR